MTEQQFYLLNLGVLAFLAVLFLLGRRKPLQPSHIHVTAPPPEDSAPKLKGSGGSGSKESKPPLLESSACLFMFNGHSWDAHEVLGVSRGASLDDIKGAFDIAIKKSDKKSHEFLKAALSALLVDLRDRGFQPKP